MTNTWTHKQYYTKKFKTEEEIVRAGTVQHW